MLNSKDFSKRLQKILDFYGLTASALAEEIDFNRSTISHLVSGRNKPSLEFVMKLLQKFPELDMDWLVLGKGPFPIDDNSKHLENLSKPKPIPDSPKIPENYSDNKVKSIPISTIKSERGEIDRIVIFFKNGTFKVYEN